MRECKIHDNTCLHVILRNHNLCTKRRPTFLNGCKKNCERTRKLKRAKKKRSKLLCLCREGKQNIYFCTIHQNSQSKKNISTKNMELNFPLRSRAVDVLVFSLFISIRVFKVITQLFHNKRKSFLRLWNRKKSKAEKISLPTRFRFWKKAMKFLRLELFAPKVLLFCGESWEQNKQKAPNSKKLQKMSIFGLGVPRNELEFEF